jgi:hypothetical protein
MFVCQFWRWFYPRFYRLVWCRPPDLADPPNHFFFFKFWIRAVIGHFPTAMWQPPIGPRHPLLCQPAMSVPHHRIDHVIANSPCHVITVRTVQTSTWKNPIGPWMVQKCQIWVTRGSLWCYHITMLTCCMTHPVSSTVLCMCVDTIVMLTSIVQMLTHPPADWARLTKL